MLDRPSPLRDVDELDELEGGEHAYVVGDHAKGGAKLSRKLFRACDSLIEDGEHSCSNGVRQGDFEALLDALS
jgi:hypothetical protein